MADKVLKALSFGLFSVAADALANAPALLGDAGRNGRGIVLANIREKLTLNVGDIPAEFTVQISVQRTAVNDAESLAIATARAIQDGKKAERTKAEASKNADAEKRMFELGQQSTLGTLAQFDRVARGMSALAGLTPGHDGK